MYKSYLYVGLLMLQKIVTKWMYLSGFWKCIGLHFPSEFCENNSEWTKHFSLLFKPKLDWNWISIIFIRSESKPHCIHFEVANLKRVSNDLFSCLLIRCIKIMLLKNSKAKYSVVLVCSRTVKCVKYILKQAKKNNKK